MKKIIVGMIILVVAGYGLLSFHFVLFDDSFKIIQKTGVRYEDTFVDARGSKKAELLLKPNLVAAGINDLIGHAGESIKEATQQ